jgi:redox-sensitive bicupin YhaK (pirin superfamily)
MTFVLATKVRAFVHRTRGSTHGPVTRLVSPGDLGELLKPFVFLDLFDHEGPAFSGPLHPHSGIATLTYVVEGAVNYIDPDKATGTVSAGGIEWMQAGRGMWHGGGIDKPGRTRGFQLWIACRQSSNWTRPSVLFWPLKMYRNTAPHAYSWEPSVLHRAPSHLPHQSTISPSD